MSKIITNEFLPLGISIASTGVIIFLKLEYEKMVVQNNIRTSENNMLRNQIKKLNKKNEMLDMYVNNIYKYRKNNLFHISRTFNDPNCIKIKKGNYHINITYEEYNSNVLKKEYKTKLYEQYENDIQNLIKVYKNNDKI
jgi:hypothetical protein